MTANHRSRTRRQPIGGPVGQMTRRTFIAGAAGAALSPAALAQSPRLRDGMRPAFKRIRPQFIAALAAPAAGAGRDAQRWGLWRHDPGPRGVPLKRYGQLAAAGGVAPAGWRFDAADWWLEEHGLIMEAPEFPLPPGRYVVTGNRAVTAVLTVRPADAHGERHWMLSDGATIHDVTHLRCRSARYLPSKGAGSCSPADASKAAFPVRPGAAMPAVPGCDKQDYAVLIVTGLAVDNG